ncbi:helicase HerA domain-containing protein [uncultured Enterovirga sp.]|uniref:helicase HerA domain-containing protein n=1 Tax=uncultured Enterovirga sp. TaxID=2026352 RepID=UPI0035CA3CC3
MGNEIDLGLSGGSPALLDLGELLATRLLVQGNSGSGKSHLLRRLLEQSAGLVQQAVIDPEGDFVSLAERYGHVVVEADGNEAELQRIAARVREHRVSVVLSLEGLDAEEQMRAAASFLGGLFDADRDRWYPMLVVVDEAQLFAPAAASDVSDEARRLSLGAMTNLMCRGRKRGLAGIIATQRLAKLAKNVAAEASNFLMGRTFLDIDMARAADLLGLERRQAEMFRDLARGQFVALGPALSKRPLTIAIGPTITDSRNGSPMLMPLPEPSADARSLILAAAPGEPEAGPRPTPARPRRPAGSDVLVQLANYRPPVRDDLPEAEPCYPEERDAAMAAILAEILGDADSGMCNPATLYQDFTVRCRMRRIDGAAVNLSEFKRRLAVARAGAGSGTSLDGEDWERAQVLAASLPDDLAGLFLVIARAAITAAPCPSHASLAEAYGTSSAGRARRMLAYLEERGVIVIRRDLRGAPIIAVPDLSAETAPGQPEVAMASQRLRGRG